MATTTHGTRCSWVLHPEAVKGYLECRKLLVERETQLVYMKIKGDMSRPLTAFSSDGTGPLTETEREIEIVRAQIAEIDALVKGGQ